MQKIDNFKVDFIGVGFPKCGTEWIAACLREHPEIDFSRHKETNYFMTDHTGLGDYICKHVKAKSFEEYKNEFKNDGRVRGEFSVHYAYDVEALEKIKSLFPEVKIIVALRDPVSYLHSAYWFLKYSNAFYDLPDSFEEAIVSSREKYICRKEYAMFSKYIKNCIGIFGINNTHIIISDDIKNDPEKTIKSLYKFIGVDDKFKPQGLFERINETQEIRSPIFMTITAVLIKVIIKLKMDKVLYDVINTENPIRDLHRKIVRKPIIYPKIDKNIERKLRKEFKIEVVKLENLINRNLSAWK